MKEYAREIARASEVSLCQITCPVCGISLWANTICPVKMESGEE